MARAHSGRHACIARKPIRSRRPRSPGGLLGNCSRRRDRPWGSLPWPWLPHSAELEMLGDDRRWPQLCRQITVLIRQWASVSQSVGPLASELTSHRREWRAMGPGPAGPFVLCELCALTAPWAHRAASRPRTLVGANSQIFGLNCQDTNCPFYYGDPVGPTHGVHFDRGSMTNACLF